MSKLKDYCTGFPEYWLSYTTGYTYIGDCCKKHDEDCKSSVFWSCLWQKKIVFGLLICLVASTVCALKYKKV